MTNYQNIVQSGFLKEEIIINIEEIYSIEGLTSKEKKLFLQWTGDTLVSLALFWKIPPIPDDCKIRVVFLEKVQFEQQLISCGLETHKSIFAVTTDRIFIRKYSDLCGICSRKEYRKLVIHECIHMLQMYSTTLIPRNYIWLYESVACYMAGQKEESTEQNLSIPQWKEFCTSFYTCTNAYYWAYKVGEYIFDNYNQEQILKICSNCELASLVGEQAWTFVSNESM